MRCLRKQSKRRSRKAIVLFLEKKKKGTEGGRVVLVLPWYKVYSNYCNCTIEKVEKVHIIFFCFFVF